MKTVWKLAAIFFCDILGTNVTSIGAYAFTGTNVHSILGLGNIRAIAANAFSECITQESVRLLSGVRAISANAFYGKAVLPDIEFSNTVAERGALAFLWLCFFNGSCSTEYRARSIPGL